MESQLSVRLNVCILPWWCWMSCFPSWMALKYVVVCVHQKRIQRFSCSLPAMNTVYAEFFPENPPARSTVAVAGLPKGALVEIECVALNSPIHGD